MNLKPYTKGKWEWVKRVNERPQTIKLLERQRQSFLTLVLAIMVWI